VTEQREVLSGWGRATRSPAVVSHEDGVAAVVDLVRSCVAGGLPRGLLARGLGRAYGDAALNAGGRVLRTDAMTGVGDIDDAGVVDVQAGASIEAVLRHAVPRGWFVPVTPGTRHVTLGGALAADVHGKNHHRDGSIGQHVEELEVVDGTGTVRTLRPGDAAYGAVVGGMGLAGIVTRVRLRLIPVGTASITVHTRRTADLDETMAALEADDTRHRYTVAWLDTLAPGQALGRGVLTSGDHSAADETGRRPTSLGDFSVAPVVPAPPWAPSGMLRASTMRVFNEAWYRKAPARPSVTTESVTSFFHPLDVVGGWNRLYGAQGFLQHQFAVADGECVRLVLELFSSERVPGFLAVLKRFGPGNDLPLSFPTAGWTLAVDMPATPRLAAVLDRADEVVAGHGGRLYLAKDSRMRPQLLPAMYPRLDEWRAQRELLDPHHLFVSDLSRRLSLC
jgi:decaprenylphospho-beta-D-ribofuranose 2-oxidase